MSHLGPRFWFCAVFLFVLLAPFALPAFLWLLGALYGLLHP